MNNNFSNNNQKEDVHLRTILDKYLMHWHWFVLSVAICVFLSYTYLRYTIPQYQASTTILVKDEKKGGMLSELSAFADMGLGNGMKSNVDNEIEILKSRTLVENTVMRLNLNIGLFLKGNIKNAEVFKNSPIKVSFINSKAELFNKTMIFEFVEMTPNSFKLKNELEEGEKTLLLDNKKEFNYGESIATQFGIIIINKLIDDRFQFKGNEKTMSIVIRPLDVVAGGYLGRLKVSPISKTSSVVEVSIIDPVIDKGEAFLDNLIQIYNENAAADKNFISENTSKFIANRLMLITQELSGVEKEVEQFKTSNQLTDIETEAKLFIEGSSEYNKKKIEVDIQINMVSSVLDFMKKSTNADLLPSNLITGQNDASGLINSYNQLILERNRILKSATLDNPSVVKIDQQITSLKSNVAASLGRLHSNLNIQRRELGGQEGLLDSKIGKIPVQERQFRVIARQQKVKEELYLYLLQKREETAISLAATAPNARVIDAAKASKIPVSPKKNIIYLAAMLIGLLIPFGILYLVNLLDTKVKNRFDITSRFSIPFLGDVPRSLSPNEIVEVHSRSSTAEALRIIRTNLDFMLTNVPVGRAKTIFLTSTIPGEGKTFLSVNLAGVFALSDKKVLLIGMDIRNPKLGEYIELSDNKGLTNYLSTPNAKIEDFVIHSKEFEFMDILPPGNIPPNPTELLMSNKIEELFVQFRNEYDYIIVDTAPVSLVSDTLIIAKYADTFVYVVRANYLDKRMLNTAEILHNENKLPNMALLLNDTHTLKGYGYGYGYGYGVTENKKSLYEKIFKK